MFYVVDQYNVYINEFNTREEAEQFCERWNNQYRFNEWTPSEAHIIEDN